jgi:hypothetical protein
MRFMVPQEGQPRELFSVREGAQGDLAITRREAQDIIRDLQKYEINKEDPLLEQHISIHRSQNSTSLGTTITHRIFTASGAEKMTAFINNSKLDLLWPAHSYLCPNLSHERYNPSTGPTLERIVIADDTSRLSSLIYHIFAAGPERQPVELPFCRLTHATFTHFQLFIYCCYANVPNSWMGMGASLPTRTSLLNGENSPYHAIPEDAFPSGATSLRDDQMASLIGGISYKLARGMVENFARLIPESADKWLNWPISISRDAF